jgi:predicted dehydrogenase
MEGLGLDGAVRIGVIDTGLGKQHVRAFGAHPRATVAAVCSADAARAAQVAAEFGVPHAYGDYHAMVAEAPIDAVLRSDHAGARQTIPGCPAGAVAAVG